MVKILQYTGDDVRQLRKILPLLIIDVKGTLQYFNHFIGAHFITPLLV